MFSIHRKLFLALKKVQIVKMTSLRFPLPGKKNPPSPLSKISDPPKLIFPQPLTPIRKTLHLK